MTDQSDFIAALRRAGALLNRAMIVYPPSIPGEVPEGRVLVHNHVRPARRQGTRGFRFWLQNSNDGIPVERCGCGWAPELADHYRVIRNNFGKSGSYTTGPSESLRAAPARPSPEPLVRLDR